MKVITQIILAGTVFLFTACTNYQNQDRMIEQNKEAIFEKGEQLPADLITGKAWHNKLVEEDTLYTTAIGVEEFEASSRNVWHSHPGGQILIVLDGVGYHQIKEEPIKIVRKGDVVKCPPNVLHWHGASKNRSVTQMYILPNTEKGLADWSKRVTDNEYNNIKQKK